MTEIITPAQAMPMAPTDLPLPDKFTDLANSYALIAMADRELRHTPGIGYHFWDGTRFQHDDGDVYVREAAKRVILAQRLLLEQRQADGLLTNGEVDAWQKWLKRSQNDGLLKSMLRVARTDPRINAYVRELDAHPNELNTQSGILDLDTFELRDHDPAALHMKVTRAGYDPTAVAPFWLETIEKALPDPDVRRYVQKYLGQACRGSYAEHLLVAHGQTGSNLKSTIFGAVEDVLGDYACRASSDLLVDHAAGSARSDTALASTRGVRFVLASETAEGVPLNDTLIKMLTGEHEITAKYMRQDYFTFSNQSAVALITNHRPRVQSSDEAIWRRLVLVPFEYVVPLRERLDPKEAQARLRAERDGILLWLIEGLRLWRDEGLREPPEAIRSGRLLWPHRGNVGKPANVATDGRLDARSRTGGGAGALAERPTLVSGLCKASIVAKAESVGRGLSGDGRVNRFERAPPRPDRCRLRVARRRARRSSPLAPYQACPSQPTASSVVNRSAGRRQARSCAAAG